MLHRIMPKEIIGNHGLPVGSVSTDEEDDGNVVMQMADQMNFSAAVVFFSGIDDWKKKFELGGLPDTPNILDSPLIPADRTSLYR